MAIIIYERLLRVRRYPEYSKYFYLISKLFIWSVRILKSQRGDTGFPGSHSRWWGDKLEPRLRNSTSMRWHHQGDVILQEPYLWVVQVQPAGS